MLTAAVCFVVLLLDLVVTNTYLDYFPSSLSLPRL